MTAEEEAFGQLAAIIRRLRGPGGCPWDRAQTHESLRPYALEESREVVVAIAGGRPAELCAELGDLLLQVLLHAAIAEETGTFTLEQVLTGLAGKLVRRHPHVFGAATADTPAEVERHWAKIKAAEAADQAPAAAAAAARTDWLSAVPRGLDPLAEARALGVRAAEVGFDWSDAEAAWDKVQEECAEFREVWQEPTDQAGALEQEFGDLLLALVSVGRLLGLDAELALVSANAKFRRRFGEVEALVGPGPERLRAAGPDGLDTAWRQVKGAEGAGDRRE